MRFKRMRIAAIGAFLMVACFVWGAATMRYKTFPHAVLQSIAAPMRVVPKPKMELLAIPEEQIDTPSEPDAIRSSMHELLEPTESISTESIDAQQAAATFLYDIEEYQKASAERALKAAQQRIVISGSFSAIPDWRWQSLYLRNGGENLLIIHGGHADNPFHSGLMEQALAAGFDVILMTMPGVSWNKLGRQRVRTWDGEGWIEFQTAEKLDHGALEMLNTNDHHFIGFFISPVLSSLDTALAHHQYRTTSMVGLSGGGWTTVLAAAVDTRIDTSISVAGTLPFFARQQNRDIGDAEQTDHAFYRRYPWPLIYYLASQGQHGTRSLKLIFNQDDPCCFDGYSARVLEKYKSLTEAPYGVEILNRKEHSFDVEFIMRVLKGRSG